MKAKISKSWPFLFIVCVWIIFTLPYFVKNTTPFPSTYLVNSFPPWASDSQFAGPVKNNAMPDVITQIYPWKKFTIESFKSLQVPFWNPYSFSGTPHLANYQSAVFSPFNILFLILPFIDAWRILILIQPLLAGIFMYLFLRSLNLRKLGSVIGSVSFMFCGFIAVWMAYGTLSFAILFLPLALYAIRKYIVSKKSIYLLLLSLTVPLSFFSGHFQISLYFFLSAIFFAFYSSYKEKFRVKIALFVSITSGVLLSMPQLLPSWEFYENAVRSTTFLITEAIPIPYLITSFAPDFFGNAVTRNDWYGHYAEWASFAGVIPIVLAIFAFIKPKKDILFFVGLGVVSLLLSLDTPLLSFLVSLKIPVISTSAFSRIIVIFSFSIAVLSAFGTDILKDLIENQQKRKSIFVLGSSTLILIVIWGAIYAFPIMPIQESIVAKRNLVLPTIIFGFTVFLIALSYYIKKFSYLFLFGILILSSFDSLRFVQKWMPYDPPQYIYPESGVLNALQAHTKGVERIFGNLGGETTVYFNLPSIEGYDPLYIEKYGEFLKSASTGVYSKPDRSVAVLSRRSHITNKVLDVLGTSIIFHPIADTNQSWAFPVTEDLNRFNLIYKDDRFHLYRNNQSLERARLFYDFEILNDKKKILRRIFDDDFDYKNKLVMEDNPNIEKNPERATGSAKILSYAPNSIKIDIKSNNSGLLFLSDNFYPGWKAKVNGEEKEIFKANYSFRAVEVPSGKSSVEFSYFPESFKNGLILAIFGVFLAGVVYFFGKSSR